MGIGLIRNWLRMEAGNIAIKQEIQKILKRANSRIRNVKNAGVTSPALKLLEAERGVSDRFSVFSVGGMDATKSGDWQSILDEYTRAVAFLNNPTSSVSGSRKFIKTHIQSELGIKDFDIANKLMDEVTEYEINGKGEINIFKYTETLKGIREQKNDWRVDINDALRIVDAAGGSLLEVLKGAL